MMEKPNLLIMDDEAWVMQSPNMALMKSWKGCSTGRIRKCT
jgi:hypothetical protein